MNHPLASCPLHYVSTQEGVLTSREDGDNEGKEVLPRWAVHSIGAKYPVCTRAPDATHQGSLTRIGAWMRVTGAEQEEDQTM